MEARAPNRSYVADRSDLYRIRLNGPQIYPLFGDPHPSSTPNPACPADINCEPVEG